MLTVSVASAESGPVLVLAGEADVTSVERLDQALDGLLAGQAVRLTIDATDLRYVDSAAMRALMTAAMKARTQDGGVTLLNPQPPVARLIELWCVDDMISVQHRK